LFLIHRLHLMLKRLETSKCWARMVSRAIFPEWAPSWNCLTNAGASDSGMPMQPSANFHHLFSRKCPSSVLRQACSCGVCYGSHLAKGHGNKAGVKAVGASPLMKGACLASLSAL
jgi:hypothetical protein